MNQNMSPATKAMPTRAHAIAIPAVAPVVRPEDGCTLGVGVFDEFGIEVTEEVVCEVEALEVLEVLDIVEVVVVIEEVEDVVPGNWIGLMAWKVLSVGFEQSRVPLGYPQQDHRSVVSL
jgi:hypothetical protein